MKPNAIYFTGALQQIQFVLDVSHIGATKRKITKIISFLANLRLLSISQEYFLPSMSVVTLHYVDNYLVDNEMNLVCHFQKKQ